MIPLFGRTQYRRGAVVFTLKQTLRSVGFESLRLVVTTSEKGPVATEKDAVKTFGQCPDSSQGKQEGPRQ